MSKRVPSLKSPWSAILAFGLALALPAIAPGSASQSPQSLTRFAGVWTGTQLWKTSSPSPYTREGQPVSLEIRVSGDTISGSITPFLGMAEGATFSRARITGSQLRATAIIGAPRETGNSSNWPDSVVSSFEFNLDGNDLAGTAQLNMGEVPWLKFEYRLRRP
jgi:hypothetical protein